ncbi:MAG: preprotein translocase subunit SecG [Anditalea sp.]
MFTIIISFIIILSVLLILVILGQNSKGGVGAAFGGSASQVMGVTKTGNILEKSTWVLAVSVLLLSLVSSAFHSTSSPGYSSPNIENASKQMITPSFDDSESLLPIQEDLPTEPAENDTTEGGE